MHGIHSILSSCTSALCDHKHDVVTQQEVAVHAVRCRQRQKRCKVGTCEHLSQRWVINTAPHGHCVVCRDSSHHVARSKMHAPSSVRHGCKRDSLRRCCGGQCAVRHGWWHNHPTKRRQLKCGTIWHSNLCTAAAEVKKKEGLGWGQGWGLTCWFVPGWKAMDEWRTGGEQ